MTHFDEVPRRIRWSEIEFLHRLGHGGDRSSYVGIKRSHVGAIDNVEMELRPPTAGCPAA